MFLRHSLVKIQYCGSLCDGDLMCSASHRQGSKFEFCVWRTVSFHSSHHPQEAQFSLHVHKGGVKPHAFHFISIAISPVYKKKNSLTYSAKNVQKATFNHSLKLIKVRFDKKDVTWTITSVKVSTRKFMKNEYWWAETNMILASQQTRHVYPMLAHRLRRRPTIGSKYRVCWDI